MYKVKIFLLIFSIELMAVSLFAEPTLYPKELNTFGAIQNNTDSNLLADHQDSRTFWVLPPNKAQAKVSDIFLKTANLGFCKEMGDLQRYSRELSADVIKLMKLKSSQQVSLQAKLEKANQLREEAEGFAVERGLQNLSYLEDMILSIESRLVYLYEQLDKCKAGCQSIEDEIQISLNDKNKALRERRQIFSATDANQKEYYKKQKKALAALESYKSELKSYNDLVVDIVQVRTSLFDSYSTFGKLAGANARISYISSWDENLQKLRQENPGINFQKTATKNAKLYFEIVGTNALDGMNGIRAVSMAGTTDNGAVSFASFPESLSGSVELSLIGACPMVHPEYFDIDAANTSEMNYGLITSYDYDVLFQAKATVTYNMYKLYQKIVSSGSSGGLFSSRSWSKIEERNFFRDNLTISWNDPENSIPESEKIDREKEMQLSVLQRLSTLVLQNMPSRGDVASAGSPGPHGAIVISDSLIKHCPQNKYCLAGAAIFKALDAIFGNSSATASYTKIQDVQLIENYERTGKITKSAVTSYL